MSSSFEARFSTTSLLLDKLLGGLDTVLQTCGIQPNGYMQLQSYMGWPTPAKLELTPMEQLISEDGEVRDRWGFAILGVSQHLFEVHGASDAAEVELNVFRSPEGPWTVIYRESESALQERVKSDEGVADLYELLMALCKWCEFEYGFYAAAETDRTVSPVPTFQEIEARVRARASGASPLPTAVVVSVKRMNIERAQALAVGREEAVRMSIDGYLLFPFLT